MDVKLIKDFFLRIKPPKKWVEREISFEILENKVTAIIGPRRAGKTYLFLHLLTKLNSPMYVNGEDIAFKYLSPAEFLRTIQIFTELRFPPKTILIDEVQELKEWNTLTRTLLDRHYNVLITGSSSKLLSKEIATQLRGRSLTYLLLPFSFREFLKAKNKKPTETLEGIGETLSLLSEYMLYGGFPEVVLFEQKEKILKQYGDEIFFKDFVERHKIKSIEFGRFLFEYMFQNFAKEISLKKAKNFISSFTTVSNTTLYNYIDKLEDTLSIFFLDKYSAKVRVRKTWPKKVYVVDLGITQPLSFDKEMGRRMENTVFLELLRKTNENPLISIFYFKDYQQREVDFVIKERNRVRELIQVTHANDKDEIERREIKSLLKASELLNCKNLKVITWDYESIEEIKGKRIEFIPLWKWLLNL